MHALVVKIDIAIDIVGPCSNEDTKKIWNLACIDAVYDP
jgi:hypothetical protein